jgi:hypothetical protein
MSNAGWRRESNFKGGSYSSLNPKMTSYHLQSATQFQQRVTLFAHCHENQAWINQALLFLFHFVLVFTGEKYLKK